MYKQVETDKEKPAQVYWFNTPEPTLEEYLKDCIEFYSLNPVVRNAYIKALANISRKEQKQ